MAPHNTRRNDSSGGGTAAAGTAAAGAEDMLIGADLTPTAEHAAGLEETQTFTIECMHNYRNRIDEIIENLNLMLRSCDINLISSVWLSYLFLRSCFM